MPKFTIDTPQVHSNIITFKVSLKAFEDAKQELLSQLNKPMDIKPIFYPVIVPLDWLDKDDWYLVDPHADNN